PTDIHPLSLHDALPICTGPHQWCDLDTPVSRPGEREGRAADVDELPIGRRVAYWRGRRRMSQQVFADRLGKSKSWVDKVERGVRDRKSTRLNSSHLVIS